MRLARGLSASHAAVDGASREADDRARRRSSRLGGRTGAILATARGAVEDGARLAGTRRSRARGGRGASTRRRVARSTARPRADPAIVARVFDTAHDPAALGDDPLFARAPGIRVPGAWSGWELAVRAVLGQQVSVAGARRTAAKLVAELGDGRRFPAPEAVADGRAAGDAGGARARAARTRPRGRRRPAARSAARHPRPRARRCWSCRASAPGRSSTSRCARCATPTPGPAATCGSSARAGAGEAERWRPWRAYAAMVLWQTA